MLKKSSRPALAGTILGLFLALSIITNPARAVTIIINCTTAELVAAISMANLTPAADTIVLADACVYNFTAGDATNSDSALPRITAPVTLIGNGATIQRDSGAATAFRLLYVDGFGGSLTLDNVIVTGGNSPGGGGIFHAGSTLTLTNSTISGNNAATFGGGIFNSGGALTVINSTIAGNNSTHGGGVYSAVGIVTLTNSRITGNNAASFGGGIHLEGGPVTVSSSTIADNSAFNGGGISNIGGFLQISNSIVWGNSSPFFGPASVIYSNIQGGHAGTGNINADPLFVNAGDYRLQDDSPVLNVGSNAELPADTLDLDGDLITAEQIPFDRDGNPRVFNAVVDMGAYENQSLLVDELLDNGGFEEDLDTNNVPDGWTLANKTGDKLTCDPAKAHSGNCAFAFKGSVSENAKLSQTVDLTGLSFNTGDTLSLSAYFKGNNATAKTKVILSVTYTGNPTPVKSKLTVKRNAAYTLREVADYALTASALDTISVTFQYKSGAGKVYIDDASLMHTQDPGLRRSAVLPPPAPPPGFRGQN